MQFADALRVGVNAARQVARGDDYAQELAERAYEVFSADGAGITQWRVTGTRVGDLESMTFSSAGVARLTPDQVAVAVAAAPRHPSFTTMLTSTAPGHRLSDIVPLERFWDSEVYAAMHAHSDARYPAAVVLHRSATTLTFLGIHRQVRDLDESEFECLAARGGPLRGALTFREALDRAVSLLGETPNGPFTAAEAHAIVLVSRGWTTKRIARQLGVSESAVKHRLASARDRVGAASRTELVARWASNGPHG